MLQSLTEAWGFTQSYVHRAQNKKKQLHDQSAAKPSFRVGDQVFLYDQQPTPPRLTSSQDHRVGHITCVFVRIGLGSARWLRVRRQALNWHITDFINSLPTLPATANDQSIPSWLKPILCPQWGHCISTGLNGDSRMA